MPTTLDSLQVWLEFLQETAGRFVDLLNEEYDDLPPDVAQRILEVTDMFGDVIEDVQGSIESNTLKVDTL